MMALFERRLFLKPICHTVQGVASGISSDMTPWQKFFTIPWNKLGYLKRIEIGRACHAATRSDCIVVDIYDDFYDPITEISGLVKRKAITIPPSGSDFSTSMLNWDETEDVPLIGDIYVVPSISGLDITLCCRLMG